MEQVKEVSAQPTPQLKFVGGKLHQLVQVAFSDDSSRPEWRAVPSEEAVAVAVAVDAEATQPGSKTEEA